MKNIKVKFGFLSVMLILSLIISGNKFTWIALLCAAIHELGHIFASKFLKMELCEFNFGILGARLKTSSKLYSYKKEIILCLFGPLFNFISVLLYLIFFNIRTDLAEFFILSSLSLGILNLLPIKSFDGGRIFECILLNFTSVKISRTVINVTSFIAIFTLWCISVYLLLIYASSLNLFIFSLSLFSSIFIQDQE